MIKYFCDRCGAEIHFDEAVKMGMDYIKEYRNIGEGKRSCFMCLKCLAEFNKFMKEGKKE